MDPAERERLQRLAGGLAHDLNNLLNAFVGYGELLRAALPATGELRPYADGIADAGRRGVGFSRLLAVLGGRVTARRRPCDLAEVARRCLDPLPQPPLLAPAAPPCPAHADPDLLVEAVAMAAAHARRCLPCGSQLTVVPLCSRPALLLDLGVPLPSGAGLFEPYRPARPGLKGGLGLCAAHELMRLAGDGLDSDGARLVFACLPPQPVGADALAGRTVVLAVADPRRRAALEQALAATGATVLAGDSPAMAEGLARVLSVPVDAVVGQRPAGDGPLAGVRWLPDDEPGLVVAALGAPA